MKNIFIITAGLMMMQAFNSCSTANNATVSAPAEVDYDAFYTTLSPYGRWVDYAPYGEVWICNEPGFRPYYTNGYWNYADAGWIWVSDYSWGWGPFHYGRWQLVPGYGWIWVPGYEWAPAWVAWRQGGEHYGWAPLEPGISVNTVLNGGWHCPDEYWIFVPHRYIMEKNFTSYVVNKTQNTAIINNTTIINNTNVYRNNKFITGPDKKEVEAKVNHPVEPLRVNDLRKPKPYRVENNTLHTYRPVLRKPENFKPDGGGHFKNSGEGSRKSK